MIPDNLDTQDILRALRRPNPDWLVTVQKPEIVSGEDYRMGVVPGFVQIDDVSNGQNHWSKSIDTLRAEGIEVPDFNELPTGQYTFEEACVLLQMQCGEWPALPEIKPITTRLEGV